MTGRRVHVLMYHDVPVDAGSIRGPAGQRSYSVSATDLKSHVRAFAQSPGVAPSTCWDLAYGEPLANRWAITFDDGFDSSPAAAEIVESAGWRAHFFIVTGSIGHPGRMTAGQILELRARGHVIGSHTVSHPDPMSDLSYERLLDEWHGSLGALSDLLGEPVRVASVPGGSLSTEVAASAAEAGIEVLFTSEPISRVYSVEGCTVIGRYAIRGTDSADATAALAAGSPVACASRWLGWNSRKAARRVLGKGYYVIRAAIMESRAHGPGSADPRPDMRERRRG